MSMPMPMPMPNNNGSSVMYMNHMTMHMSFFWGKDVVLLFCNWPGNHSIGMYVLALVVVFLLAVGAEILSDFSRMKLRGLSPVVAALIQTGVFAVRMGLAYLVMLSVMSYNIGVFVVAVTGHAVGYFVVEYRVLAAGARKPDSIV